MEFNFAANPTLDSVDTVPEAFRGAYVQGEDGKFSVRPEVAGLASAMDGLNGALKKERDANKTLKQQPTAAAVLKELGLGETVEAAQTSLTDLRAQIAAKAQVDPAKIKSEIEATFQTERDGFKTQLSDMEATLVEHLVGNVAKSAIAEHKGNELFLMPHIEKAAKVVKDDASGKYVVRVVDGDGQFRGDGKGGFMGVSDLVGEMKANKLFGGAFESDQQGGGGKPATPTSRQATQFQQQREQQQGRSSTDKIAGGLQRLQQVGSLGAA